MDPQPVLSDSPSKPPRLLAQPLPSLIPAQGLPMGQPAFWPGTRDLRARLDRDGCLHLSGLLDPGAIAVVRRDILLLCRDHGWLEQGADLEAGLFANIPIPDHQHAYMALYRQLLRLESFNRLASHPRLVLLMRALLGGEILVHPRTIARIAFPGHDDFITQPHQDYHYIHGSQETLTAWIPLGDCPPDLGPLAVWASSHRLGPQPHRPAIGAGGAAVDLSDLAGCSGPWLGHDFRCGDVLVFHSLTIHAATPNRSRNRLRLSVDYRYQRRDQPVDPASMGPHGG